MREIRSARTLQTVRLSRSLGTMPVVGVIIVLSLMAIGVARHPLSLQGAGSRLLWLDVALLLTYGITAILLQYRGSAGVRVVIPLGTRAGLMLGTVLVANHVIELFVSDRNFALVIGPVLLMLALFGATGSTAMERTGSLLLAAAAGLWCAMVGILILLCAGFLFTLTLEARVELWLREAFVASAMDDPGAFAVQNSLEAASEALLRMPVIAFFLSLLGALANTWITNRPRAVVLVVGFFVPFMFVAGATALCYANSLPRTARPPFVLAGVLLASVALTTAHPMWLAIRHRFSE